MAWRLGIASEHITRDDISHSLTQVKPLATPVSGGLAERTKNAIDERSESLLLTHALAKELCSSPSGIERQFHDAYGISIRQYLMTVRVRHAERLLASSDVKVDSVALTVGFNSRSAFYRSFKTIVGHAPRAVSVEK